MNQTNKTEIATPASKSLIIHLKTPKSISEWIVKQSHRIKRRRNEWNERHLTSAGSDGRIGAWIPVATKRTLTLSSLFFFIILFLSRFNMIYFIYFFFLFWNIISEICGFFPRYFWYLGGPSSRLDSTRFLSSSSSSSSSSIFILLLHILSFSSIIPLFFFSFPSFILLLFFFYHFFFLYFWFLPFHRGLSVLMPLSLSLHGFFFFFFFLVFFLLGGFIYLIYGLHSCRREPPRIPKESGKKNRRVVSLWVKNVIFSLFCFVWFF